MAKDDDWEDFLRSTKEGDEEVETPEEDETSPKPKKTEKDPEKKSNPDEEEEDPGKDPKDDKSEKPADPEKKPKEPEEGDEDPKDPPEGYKTRLKQFAKEDGTLDGARLEKSYIDSSKEAVKLKDQVKELEGNYNQLLDAIKAKPETAKAIFGEEGAKKLKADSGKDSGLPDHPVIKHMEAQINNRGQREYDEFVEKHPEAVSDPEKARKIGAYIKIYSSVYREENGGEIPPMKDALEAAYRHYGWDLETKDKKELAGAVKKKAASRSTPKSSSPPSRRQISEAEDFFAKKLGVKL